MRAQAIGTVSPHVELTPVSQFVELWPPYTAIDGAPAVLRIELPLIAALRSPEHLLMYRQTRDGWEALPRLGEAGDLESGSTQFGVFAMMEDTVAPRIRVIAPASPGQQVSRRPEIKAEIRDEGSGIDRFNATCNGQWLLMEYDPEQHLLIWERDEDLPAGPVRIEFEVTDRARNTSRRELELTLPQ